MEDKRDDWRDARQQAIADGLNELGEPELRKWRTAAGRR
jgi:hypothetical protein